MSHNPNPPHTPPTSAASSQGTLAYSSDGTPPQKVLAADSCIAYSRCLDTWTSSCCPTSSQVSLMHKPFRACHQQANSLIQTRSFWSPTADTPYTIFSLNPAPQPSLQRPKHSSSTSDKPGSRPAANMVRRVTICHRLPLLTPLPGILWWRFRPD